MTASGIRGLRQLAALHGVQTAYYDVSRQRQVASADSLLAILSALGAPCDRLEDVSSARREREQQIWRRPVEAVSVVWYGEPASLQVRHQAPISARPWTANLSLESGQQLKWSLKAAEMPEEDRVIVEGTTYIVRKLTLPERLPWGYHRLSLEIPTAGVAESMILVSPRTCFAPDHGNSWWGVFLPLYALQTATSWGSGDISGLTGLARWCAEMGGNLVGTLPLLAAFLDRPYDPSPYSPVSRLAWNEFYLDVSKVPGVDGALTRRRQWSGEPSVGGIERDEIERLRTGPVVDYRRVMELKRGVVEQAARDFFAKPGYDTRRALDRFVAENPFAEDYSQFRAAMEKQQQPWPRWPERLRKGDLAAGAYDREVKDYHLFAQWQISDQIDQAARESRTEGMGLYLDLPLGVRPDGYDAWRWQDLFASSATVGAPPDPLAAGGQDWQFHPPIPEKLRENGYQYFRSYLRHHLNAATVLRIDHVMGFHRLFCIPKGGDSSQGVYVRYPAEEFYAILALESQKSKTGIVGEDLGTVPKEVRPAMSKHGLGRMYVMYFNLSSAPGGSGLKPVPGRALASVNTHDLPTFAGYCQGADIDDMVALGQLTEQEAAPVREQREKLVAALVDHLSKEGPQPLNIGDLESVLGSLLEWLGRSKSPIVMVNLEDLWLERQPHNVPGTSEERPNWGRKSRHSLEEIVKMPEVLTAIRRIAAARGGAIT